MEGLIRFNYSIAEYNKLVFWYADENDENIFHYAIGKNDWVPIPFVVFLMAGCVTDGIDLLCSVVSDTLAGLNEDDPEFKEWLRVNDSLLTSYFNHDSLKVVNNCQSFDINSDDFGELSFHLLKASVVSSEYKTIWRQCYPKRAECFYSVSDEYASYLESPIKTSVNKIVKEAMTQIDSWVVDWFKYRGFKINKTNNLIYLKDFSPFYKTDLLIA
jgi:hypothetical protein